MECRFPSKAGGKGRGDQCGSPPPQLGTPTTFSKKLLIRNETLDLLCFLVCFLMFSCCFLGLSSISTRVP